jgi:hypothetical protein
MLSEIREPDSFPLNRDDWKREQLKDAYCYKLINQINNGVEHKPYYLDRNGVLRVHRNNRQSCIVVPKHLRRPVLKMMHDHVLSGHMGVRKTIFRTKNRYFWPKMSGDVARYERGCETCQKVKLSNIGSYGYMDSRHTYEAGSTVCCDLIGPLPRSPAGNGYALVIVDELTRFIEVYPLRHATSKSVVDKFTEYCCRYVWPRTVRTDNETQFTSKVWSQVCDEMGIKRRHTSLPPSG